HMHAPLRRNGIAQKKQIHETANGQKYVIVGEHILVGPHATLPKRALSEWYNPLPKIAFSSLPVANIQPG
ncbi:MAG: hypothetical protein WBD71_09375, partial [Xanthobacteraceae bacterium]